MAKTNEIKYLTAIKTEKRQKKYCRFKKFGIKYIDYKDADFLKKFLNEQGSGHSGRSRYSFADHQYPDNR